MPGQWWEQDDPESSQNPGVPGHGQMQQTDTPSAWVPQNPMFQQPQAPSGYQQPAAPAPQAPAPSQQIPSGRDGQDPTRMVSPATYGGVQTIAQGGLNPSQTQPQPNSIPQASQAWMQSAADPSFAANPISSRPPTPGQAPAPTPQANLIQGQMNYSQMGRGQAQINPMAFEGFNRERALAGGDTSSAKDAFRDIVGSSGIDVRGLTKPEVGAKLQAELIPLLESRGYPARIQQGSYDIIEVFSDERGWEPIDVVRGAGGDDAAWQWGDQPGMGAPQGQFNPALMQQAAQGMPDEDMALAQQVGIDTNNPLWRQMFEQWYGEQNQPHNPDPTGSSPSPSYY